MKKIQLALAATLVMVLLTAAPVQAITYGEPDANEHPYVGFMLLFDPAEPGWFSCSGTLLDADTFLTAGHCTYGIGHDGVAGDPSGGNDVWVTFTETINLSEWPKRADYPDNEAGLYIARSDWLNSNASFTRGTSHPNPNYDNFAEFPVNHDVGVVELDGLVWNSPFGALAPLGTVEAIIAMTPRNPNDALIETVGFGIQSLQPKPMEVDARYKSTSRIVETKGNQSAGGNLHTLNNPSRIGGRGGSCFGDSGGPVLVPGTNQVVAIVSYGFSAVCHGADYSWRVDIESSRTFILSFMSD
ncbi:MAG: trypsin-like serine protease [Candidatus Limnocylindrales bacterium]